MAQMYDELVVEIDRIVNSPYPTTLKRLRDIIQCDECTEADISRWIAAKPCQIDRLARCVLDGLRQWPYVLDIVTEISYHAQFRDALLRHEPGLLNDIIIQATRAQEIHSRYTSAAVTILSHPITGHISLPSATQTLFIRLFDHAAQEPSVVTIKPIYQILKGTSTLLLGLLSKDALRKFEGHLFDIIRNMKGDNQSPSLYCLAIMKTMASASESQLSASVSAHDTQELLASASSSSSCWTPDAMKQFFTDSKAQKVMQLVVLRAMWSCTASTGESFDERMDSLVLAQEVIEAVPVYDREIWRRTNALLVRKLEEKALASFLELELRFQALCLLVRITQGNVVSAMVMDGLRQAVIRPEELSRAVRVNSEFLATCGIFDQNTTTAFIQNVVDFAASAGAQDLVQHSHLLVQVLPALSRGEETITEGIVLALDVLSCGQKLYRLKRLLSSNEEGNLDEGICTRAVRSARHHLTHELCRCFLTATFSLRGTTYSTSPETIALLLDLHAVSAQQPPTCAHARPPESLTRPTLSLVEAENTPCEPIDLDWRRFMRSELENHARSEHDRLINIFSKTCEGLERRCEDVEGPLREELEMRKALQIRYDELDQAYASLESDGINHHIQLSGLEAEKDQAVGKLDAMRQNTEAMLHRIKTLESELVESKAQGENALNDARKVAETAEMEYATALAKKEEEVEDLRASVAAREEELSSKAADVARFEELLMAVESDRASAKRQLEDSDRIQDEQYEAISRLSKDLDGATATKAQLGARLQGMSEDMDALRQTHQDEFGRFRHQAEEDRAMAKSAYDDRLAEMVRQHEAEVESLRHELSSTREGAHQAEERYATEIERRDTNLGERQKRVDRLNRKCEQKDQHIAEANAMRANLMAAMGLNGQQSQFALPHRPSRTSTAQTQQTDPDSQDPSPPTPRSDNDIVTQKPELGGSFASAVSSTESRSGPTLKRARPRNASKVPAPAKLRLSVPSTSRSSRPSGAGKSTAKRQPLNPTTGNQSIRKSTQQETTSKIGAENVDETTFDGSELFGGTPGEKLLGLDNMLDVDSQDRL